MGEAQENFSKQSIKTREFDRFIIEALSVGKNKKDQSLNEDRWIANDNTLAVIDGATPRIPRSFAGKSSGQFAADAVKDVLANLSLSSSGRELVERITAGLNDARSHIWGSQNRE